MNASKVWLVTGASKGLGLQLVTKLLQKGHQVAATSRSVEDLQKAVGVQHNFLPLTLDVSNDNAVKLAIEKVVTHFGHLDVVVNNAGYGQLGTLEELTDEEARRAFDINVFGSLNIIRNTMPYLRQQRSGYIINISSIAGFVGGFPGWGVYNASKFAVAGMTEALAAEAQSLGIKTTIVYPGYFRTEFLSKESLRTAKHPIDDYKEARELDRVHLQDIPGNQPGDPQKGAEALIELVSLEQAPLHFFMGSDSFGMASQKIDAVQKDLSAHESLSKSTDYAQN
ncbi:SDR family NAD(P)-dependent oxidoreductase [Pararcticibacter amylolyticus]|uniref:Short-chain dehydrogenase/reductase n=1 Tax=Pararcticibacter amylolyticus TaxID=2173175 RepID=A0A2U2PAK7_9SPHI|nr:SDR family NAD(P)-dependent oxidoreductase [Pararcticibacter amylolyticus]PWG78427.1 short-chain dehydrogenase/reductase [Pararcticibacter amylolyticus]